MPETANADVRTRLIEAAVDLVHRHGFAATRLADIARAAKVPPGNLYYYFKTKEEIGEAIVERRLAELSVMRQELSRLSSPRERLCSLVLASLEGSEMVAQFGCPMGTFCSEVNKEGGRLSQNASNLFAELLIWVEAQFREFCNKAEARGNAVHLVSALQGATVLANCSKDPNLIKMQAKRLVDWIHSL